MLFSHVQKTPPEHPSLDDILHALETGGGPPASPDLGADDDEDDASLATPRRDFPDTALWEASIRSKVWDSPVLLDNAEKWSEEALQEARRPSEADRKSMTRHAAFLVSAVLVGPQ